MAAVLGLAACTSNEGLFGGDKVDYRTEAVRTKPLDIPPDLTQLARDSRYQPVGPGGAVSAASAASAASGAASAPAASASAAAAGAAATVALTQLENMRIERAGQQRWLVVAQQTPEQLWPKIKTFWEKTGFTLTVDNAAAGVMETNWSENRAKLPADVVRNLIGSIARNLFDTGERDLYRTRLERTPDGAVEVYISHRGVEEVISGPMRDQTSWRARESDPGLEAEMLARLMLALAPAGAAAAADSGTKPPAQAVNAAVATVSAAPQPAARARVTTAAGSDRASMEVDEPFDRAWRRVGLVLDRGGFTVEDRDRAAGTYFVRYSDPKVAGQDEPNFFARVFGGAKDPQTPVRYRIVLKGAGTRTTVDVLTSDGGTASGENGQRIVARLVEDLK
ncbi:MAG: outer membrane protein assembly factor BamC [Rubrivivax sp.]|nr:outer membrane protein assembly factor BamC [Rubrivivax sp.]